MLIIESRIIIIESKIIIREKEIDRIDRKDKIIILEEISIKEWIVM